MIKEKVIVRTKYTLCSKNSDKYISNMLDYYSDEKKKTINLIDYFTGKINKKESINLVLENGKYATKEELIKRKQNIDRYINNSNLWQIVLSPPKKLVNKNISWEALEQKLAKNILPKFFKRMGFSNVDNLMYEFSLHTNTSNPHFHIAFMEKKANYIDSNGKLSYRKKGKIPQEAINYLKNELIFEIEREGKFRPYAIEINKSIDKFKSYFDKNSKNFLLTNNDNLMLETKILTLGKMLYERETDHDRRIKYNSIKEDEIKLMTKEIKDELFKNKKEIQISKSEFNDSIRNMSNYIKYTAERNNIKKEEIDLFYIKNKETYLNNYILNSIVNASKYKYKNGIDKIKINSNDIIQSIILLNYKNNLEYKKEDILNTYFKEDNNYKKYKLINNCNVAIKNIKIKMDEAIKEFEKLFNKETYKQIL